MIVNKIEHLQQYSSVYPHLSEAIEILKKTDFSDLKEGKNEFSDNVYIVKILGNKNPDFKGVLEIHKEWIDIHIALNTHDTIAYKELSDCSLLEKPYDVENDYLLYNEPENSTIVVPVNYFCLIDTTMAHMAMIGEGSIEKLVVKVKK